MSGRRRIWTTLALAGLAAAGCRQDMHDQPKLEVYEASSFFPDGQAGRMPPAGTVARGRLNEDTHLTAGRVSGEPAPSFPFPIDRAALERGRQRFQIFCTPCHGAAGDGRGMIVERGLPPPPSFHEERLKSAPPGHFFDVISSGYGRMFSYASRIPVRDRWAIVAYIRALQLSRDAPASRLSAAELESAREVAQ